MNIIFVTIGFSPLQTSGLDIVGERLVRGLLAQKHQVTIIAGRQEKRPEIFDDPGLKIIRIPLGKTHWLGFGLRAAFVLNRLVKKQAVDIVHFWDVYFAWAYRKKFIGSLNHSFYQRIATSANASHLKKLYYWLAMLLAERPAIRRASGLLAISDTSLQDYRKHYPIPESKSVLTRLGIDAKFFHPVSNTENLRVALNIPPNAPVILYSGFFTPRKGLEYLAQAMQEIQPAPWLILTGKWDDATRSRFLAQLGAARSRFIEAGFVPDDLMPSYFSMADLYVSPSLLEGFGLPLAEALACETPVVCADAGAAAEVVGPGGRLVPPGDASALAQAVSELLSAPEKRRALGKLGRNHIVENFSVETMLQAYLDAYQKFR